MTTMSAREFNQDVSAAKRAAAFAPVIITDRGKPAFVLLSFEEYRRLTGQERNVVDWLAMSDDIDLDAGRVRVELGVPDL
jgi:prevent-host-death family protein